MTWGKLINGVKYIYILNENEYKKKSLYDNVYFTLRDILANAEAFDTALEANNFNNKLTDGICFQDRTDNFKYTNALHQIDYLEKLLTWLKRLKNHYFEFIELEDGEEFEIEKYMKFDDWCVEFTNLINLIQLQYEKCCMLEEDRQVELE